MFCVHGIHKPFRALPPARRSLRAVPDAFRTMFNSRTETLRRRSIEELRSPDSANIGPRVGPADSPEMYSSSHNGAQQLLPVREMTVYSAVEITTAMRCAEGFLSVWLMATAKLRSLFEFHLELCGWSQNCR